MKIDDTTLQTIASLSRLAFEENEAEEIKRNLSQILDFVEKMNACDTSECTGHPLPLHTMLRCRDDAVSESNQRDLLQQNAPLVEAGLYLVPKVIGNGESS